MSDWTLGTNHSANRGPLHTEGPTTDNARVCLVELWVVIYILVIIYFRYVMLHYASCCYMSGFKCMNSCSYRKQKRRRWWRSMFHHCLKNGSALGRRKRSTRSLLLSKAEM